MRVRCVKIVSSVTREVLKSSSWISVGKEYDAFSIFSDNGRIELRLVGDDPLPALFDISDFEVVDGSIPASWSISQVGDSGIEIAPSSWLGCNFWERYFDGDEEAVAMYEEEVLKMRKHQ